MCQKLASGIVNLHIARQMIERSTTTITNIYSSFIFNALECFLNEMHRINPRLITYLVTYFPTYYLTQIGDTGGSMV